MKTCLFHPLILLVVGFTVCSGCDVLSPKSGKQSNKPDKKVEWIKNVDLHFFYLRDNNDTLSVEGANVRIDSSSYRTNNNGIITIDSIKTGDYKAEIHTDIDTAETAITLNDSLHYYDVEVDFSTTVIKDFSVIPYVILEGDTTRFSDLHSHYTAVKFQGELYRYPWDKVEMDYIEEGRYKIWMKWLEFEDTDSIYVDEPVEKVKLGSQFAVSMTLFVYDVVGNDTIPYNKGSIDLQIYENEQLNEEGKRTLTYLEKRESVMKIDHPNTELFKRRVDIDRNDSVHVKANPDYYTNFDMRLISNINQRVYGVPNAQVTFRGNEYITDDHGEFRIDQNVSIGYYDVLINSELLSTHTRKITVANRDPVNVEVISDTADYWPLQVGNQWTYKKTGRWEESGRVTSKLNLTEEWEIIERTKELQGTSYKVKVIQNGYKTEDGRFDTTWINDRVKYFKIIENKENTLQVVNKTYLDIEKSKNIKRYQPVLLGDTVTFGEFDDIFVNARRLVKGVGLVRGEEGSTQTTNSPWYVTLTLLSHQLK